jgi:hypothetical protein
MLCQGASKGKGKAIPLQAWTGPEGSRSQGASSLWYFERRQYHLWLLTPKNKGSRILWQVEKYLPSDKASYPKQLKPSAILLWEPEISQTEYGGANPRFRMLSHEVTSAPPPAWVGGGLGWGVGGGGGGVWLTSWHSNLYRGLAPPY